MAELIIAEDAASRRWLAQPLLRVTVDIMKWSVPVIALICVLIYFAKVDLSPRMVGLAIVTVGAPVSISMAIVAAYSVVRWLPQKWHIDSRGIKGRGRAYENVQWGIIRSWALAPASTLPGYSHLQFRWKTTWRKGKLDLVAPPHIPSREIEKFFASHAPQAERTNIGRRLL